MPLPRSDSDTEAKLKSRAAMGPGGGEGGATGGADAAAEMLAKAEAKRKQEAREAKRFPKGRISFTAFLRWWHEVGFPKACKQRRTLKLNRVQLRGRDCNARAQGVVDTGQCMCFLQDFAVQDLRLRTWLKNFAHRHLRAAHHLLREHLMQAITAGVFSGTVM